MDLDNLGPIALFIVYMAISAWSKQKKARQRTKPAEAERSIPKVMEKPMQEVSGILDQLKKELFEIDEEPLVFQQEILDEEPEEEATPEVVTAPAPAPQFVEGSQSHGLEHLKSADTLELEPDVDTGQSLEEVLEPYSKIEQGIILHEILGKPRARQENDEWFHRS